MSIHVVVAVPARYNSSRLEGKVLADIGGRPMLHHVLERCSKAKGIDAVLACTDSTEVEAAARGWGFDTILMQEECSSGSERLAFVVKDLVEAGGGGLDCTLIINVQGDQPLLDPTIISELIERFVDLNFPSVLTPVYPLKPEKIHDPNVVKVLRSAEGKAMTFSRSALPHVRDLPPEEWNGIRPQHSGAM